MTEHVSKRVQNRWPGMQWVVELYLDGGRVGENAEAESFAKEALELLEGPKSALEYRAKVLSLRHLSSKAMPLLDAKIRESMGIKSETKKNKRRLRLPRLRH